MRPHVRGNSNRKSDSFGIQIGSLVGHMFSLPTAQVKENEDSWYEIASFPVELTTSCLYAITICVIARDIHLI